MNGRRPTHLPFWLIAAAILIGLYFWWGGSPRDGRPTGGPPVVRVVEARGDLAADEKANIQLFETTKVSVVFISTTNRVRNPFSRDVTNIPRGAGSGFMWDDKGHVVTNNHVIAGASGARVRLNDGRDYAASLVGTSPAHDIAVLRISVPDRQPPALLIGTSADLKVGQKVFAIGNPFGLDWSLTTGVVSALNRSLPTEDGRGTIEQLIQTDAAINPGNSGGPLLDSAGRLIGINTLIFSPSGAYAGVGFAVPVDTVNRVVPQLIASGHYARPALGIEADEEINRMLMSRIGVKGVAVLKVSQGSPAAAAGLRPAQISQDGGIALGDVITAIDDKPVDGVPRLLARLDERKVGETVQLTVRRDGKDLKLPVKLWAGA